jgi:Ca2+-binding RTX toxin-like protein
LDITGTVSASNGHNVFGSDIAGSVAGDRKGVDPGLIFAALDPVTGGGRLALNGGPIPTAALADRLDNPALGGAETVAADATDQRGAPRPQPGDSAPDIGAFELRQTAISVVPSRGNDVLNGTPQADTLAGLAGNDRLAGLAGHDRLLGGAGGDILRGGLGDDTLDGGAGLDTASYRDAARGVRANLHTGSSAGILGVDRLVGIENLDGGNREDELTGDHGANWLGGRLAADKIFGRGGDDHLLGHEGGDVLAGGPGRDTLTGGAGADRFDVYFLRDSPAGAGRDVITDFAQGDRLNLGSIDPGVPGAPIFRFVGTAALSGPGQVGYAVEDGGTLVRASVDADAAAELELWLDGLHVLGAGDFLL